MAAFLLKKRIFVAMSTTLIIDSGSTKMEWVLLSGGQVVARFLAAGFNPNYSEVNTFVDLLHHELPETFSVPVDQIYYYGTGCGTEANQRLIERLLKLRFTTSKVHVTHDLMAAACALFGDKEGIACILGTGANSCWYDGHIIVDRAVSLGYLVGDEGSGCYIGRKLARAYFYGEMPPGLSKMFHEEHQLEYKDFIERVYHQPEASKYLAGFARFAGDHQDHPFIQDLVTACFEDFVQVFVLRYEACGRLPIGFVGSVAFHFQDLLRMVLEKHHLQISDILSAPMQGLLKNL